MSANLRDVGARSSASGRKQQAAGSQAVKIRVHPDVHERTKYWAQRHGLSANEYMALAVEEKIARENGDYDLPALEIQRMNQLIDQMVAMSSNVQNLETVVVSGFDSLLGLTRGDSNYLLDEDGELGTAGGFAGMVESAGGGGIPDQPSDDSVAGHKYGGF
ncbi:hypothetical protein [Arthrobacter bambusae]|uniref:Uncharacterized protein n=1 Tax=Arthrobacter bambusae TaxID=1338426 RepID=A0AAW8D685_9MICC|nr:hypothetical protein [Arthrobacter bambusae]MDP9903215.1 hypothetical protein [Arthrobacter bambusae]MDQ0128791.1 hypothetical protein [Arthrobacter bambusae]MDQ0180132.1 hypothetical protein [Arthrobacter bambusae]